MSRAVIRREQQVDGARAQLAGGGVGLEVAGPAPLRLRARDVKPPSPALPETAHLLHSRDTDTLLLAALPIAP